MGHYDLPVDKHPLRERVRAKANHYVTGRDGGRDIDLRAFAREGMQLHGRLLDIAGAKLSFADDLAKNLDAADNTSESIKRSIDDYIARSGITAPTEAPYVPVWQPEQDARELDCEAVDIAAVVWCIGYRPDFRFVELPAFDAQQYPLHRRGITAVPGLYFVGLPWLYTWGSGRLEGVARDAAFLVEQMCAPRASHNLQEALR
jgi:putative flavoprotein involved in K+ transport